MICCSCGKEIDINYGREYWNGIYCKKCADEMLSTPEYIKNYKRIIADLQAENAALRERLGKSPDFEVYQDVFIIDYLDARGYSVIGGNPIIRSCFIRSIMQVGKNSFIYFVQPNDLPKELLDDSTLHDEYWDRSFYSKEIFVTREAAEARLAELKGEKE